MYRHGTDRGAIEFEKESLVFGGKWLTWKKTGTKRKVREFEVAKKPWEQDVPLSRIDLGKAEIDLKLFAHVLLQRAQRTYEMAEGRAEDYAENYDPIVDVWYDTRREKTIITKYPSRRILDRGNTSAMDDWDDMENRWEDLLFDFYFRAYDYGLAVFNVRPEKKRAMEEEAFKGEVGPLAQLVADMAYENAYNSYFAVDREDLLVVAKQKVSAFYRSAFRLINHLNQHGYEGTTFDVDSLKLDQAAADVGVFVDSFDKDD